ncbi:F-box only protein 48 [Phyllopteryx taeniolatus]|uniref:F-box only protein 48 n=1 Tax=Phyllopteryx taeniolatus TaxID=161469 RepID=UPI002AD2A365|nr:F-box only protein 48 [Phyllopteryx taeniolatus]
MMNLSCCCARDFAVTLPPEMSVKIFGELDARSLCRASATCRRWNAIIRDSPQLWRTQCLSIITLCHREVDADRRNGLSWKDSLARNYIRSRVKLGWLSGQYSNVASAGELRGRKMAPMDMETWGEILQAELDR